MRPYMLEGNASSGMAGVKSERQSGGAGSAEAVGVPQVSTGPHSPHQGGSRPGSKGGGGCNSSLFVPSTFNGTQLSPSSSEYRYLPRSRPRLFLISSFSALFFFLAPFFSCSLLLRPRRCVGFRFGVRWGWNCPSGIFSVNLDMSLRVGQLSLNSHGGLGWVDNTSLLKVLNTFSRGPFFYRLPYSEPVAS